MSKVTYELKTLNKEDSRLLFKYFWSASSHGVKLTAILSDKLFSGILSHDVHASFLESISKISIPIEFLETVEVIERPRSVLRQMRKTSFSELWRRIEKLEKEVERLREEIGKLREVFVPISEIEVELSRKDFEGLKESILKYIKEHPGSLTSEIIEAFEEYDPLVVLKALYELEKEGKIEGKDVESAN